MEVPMPFPFEKLQAYQQALKFVSLSQSVCADNRDKLSGRVIDQLTRAALSIPLNIAEGCGRWHKAEKKQFYWIARGSAFECVSIFQVLQQQQAIAESQYAYGYSLLEEISRTVSGLIQMTEKNLE